ncbi:MAG: cytidine/deoxycytidylate deaminase family protein [Nanoarchaeota archaeon]|nr:cytidine/deoxycytidylate deaminase family protein [Nanoarchaeota archaeon]
MESEKKSEYKRPTWDEYFMEITEAVAKRSTCDRGRMGCVIARDKQILVTGYAGAPVGLPHCDEVGHQIKTITNEDGTVSKHCVRTTHAEQNAICQAAKIGASINGSTLYCKMTPCSTCAKMIINAGIKRVVCQKKYHAGKETEEMFKMAGVKLEIINDEIEHYENQ